MGALRCSLTGRVEVNAGMIVNILPIEVKSAGEYATKSLDVVALIGKLYELLY